MKMGFFDLVPGTGYYVDLFSFLVFWLRGVILLREE